MLDARNFTGFRNKKEIVKVKLYEVGYAIVINNDTWSTKYKKCIIFYLIFFIFFHSYMFRHLNCHFHGVYYEPSEIYSRLLLKSTRWMFGVSYIWCCEIERYCHYILSYSISRQQIYYTSTIH
jgi:hypothetical protein